MNYVEMVERLVGREVNVMGFNDDTFEMEIQRAKVITIIDGPEHDPQDYAIIERNGNEIGLPVSRLIASMDKAVEMGVAA